MKRTPPAVHAKGQRGTTTGLLLSQVCRSLPGDSLCGSDAVIMANWSHYGQVLEAVAEVEVPGVLQPKVCSVRSHWLVNMCLFLNGGKWRKKR